jgi:hypothetical protein
MDNTNEIEMFSPEEMRSLLQQEKTSNKEFKSLFEKLGYML